MASLSTIWLGCTTTRAAIRGRAALQTRPAIREKALGPQHPMSAPSLNSLALVYKDQGRHAEAEPLYKRSLAICREGAGSRSTRVWAPRSITWPHDTRHLDRHSEAEQLYKRSLLSTRRHWVPLHPDVGAIAQQSGRSSTWARAATRAPSRPYHRSLVDR